MGWLILAAGRSTRFDGDKLLSRLPHTGKTLLEFCVEKYVAHGSPVLVVTRPDHVELHKLLTQLQIAFTICPSSHLGMGSSLAWGVAQIKQHWHWVGIALADMALIKIATLVNLTSQITETSIVVPQLVKSHPISPVCIGESLQSNIAHTLAMKTPKNAYWGHPVLFGEDYFDYLLELKGDEGARYILQRYKQYIVEVTTDDTGVVFDVDSRLDMKNMVPLFVSDTE